MATNILRTMTVTEAAEATGIPAESIRRPLDRGELAGNKIGTKWYVSAASLEHWVNHRRGNEPKPEPSAFSDVEDHFS